MNTRLFIPLIFVLVAPQLVAQTPACCKSVELRTIFVSGEAEVKAAPDFVVIRLEAVTENVTLMTAKRENDLRVIKVLDIAKAYGLKTDEIQTEYASISRDYSEDENSGKKLFQGYTITKRVNLICRNLDRFEAMLNEMLDAGINQLEKVEFRSSQSKKFENQAREMAIKAAHERAVALAAKLGQKVGKPLKILDHPWDDDDSTRIRELSRLGYAGNTRMKKAATPQTFAGMIHFNAEVTVIFELE